MGAGDYLEGLAFVIVTWSAVGCAATLLTVRRLAHLRGSARMLAWALLFTAGLMLVHLVPGALTILSRWSALAAAVVLALAVWRLVPAAAPAAAAETEGASERAPADRRLSWAFAGAGVLIVGVALLAFLRQRAAVPVTHIDTLSIHLPGVARWIQSGSLWPKAEFLPRFPTGAYPSNGSLIFVAAILPFRNDAFARLIDLPFLLMAAGAVYAIARELRAPRAAAALAAALLLSVRAVTIFAVEQLNPDVILLATFGAGCLFLLRHFRTQRTSDLVLAGLGLGIAFGTKWYGPSSVIAVLAAWAVLALVARRGLRAVLRQGLTIGAVVLAAGGFWFVRNAVATGNPLWPVKVAVLGHTLFDAPRDVLRERYGFSLLDRLGQSGSWSHYILPDLRASIGWPGLALGIGLVVGLGLLVARRRRAATAQAALAAAGAALVTAAYVVTPATAQGFASHPWTGLVGGNSRYEMPALILAAAVLGWVLGRAGRVRPLLEAGVLVALIDGVHGTFGFGWGYLALVTLKLAGIAAVAGALAIGARRVARRRRPGRRAAVALGLVALIALGAAGYGLEHRFNRTRYQGLDATVDFISARAPSGHHIGVAGNWSGGGAVPTVIYPAFGPRLGNDVSFIGRTVQGMLLPYESQGPFVAALRREHPDLLDIGRGAPPQAMSCEERWAQAAGYVLVRRSARFALYRAGSAG